jgi:hypothetical protein
MLPYPNGLFIALAGAPGGALTGKSHHFEQQPDRGLAIRDAKLALNQLTNAS